MENIKGKVTIIGAGYVGSTVSYALVLCDICDEIVLIDRNIEKAQSEINDIRHGFQFVGKTILRLGDYNDCEDSDIIILAIGRNRHPGETRLDLASDNTKIARYYIDLLKPHYKNSVIIVVTNPIDIITQRVTKWMDIPYGKVIGTGCILDSSRFIRVIADYVKKDVSEVRGMIVGEHGDSQVPLWSKVKVCGLPIEEYCRNNKLEWNDSIKEEIHNKVKNMGASIIKGKARTQYGIATCTADIVNAILKDKKIVVSVSSSLQGELGLDDKVSLSYPSIIGKGGIESRNNIDWDDIEKKLFIESYNKVFSVM